MSVHVSSWVLRECDESVPGRRLVLLVLADKADADGSGAFPSVATMAHETRMSERGVRYALRALEADDRIRRAGIHPQYGTHEYVVVMRNPLQGAQSAGGQSEADSVSQIAPEPSLGTVPSLSDSKRMEIGTAETPSSLDAEVEPSRGGARARAREAGPVSFKHGRRHVPVEVAESATRLLDVFNEATGSKFKPRKRNGEATTELKQVAGALLDREDVTEGEWSAAIRATVANPPGWIDGGWIVGHVFGKKASAHALAKARPVAIAASRGSGATRDGWGAADILRIGGVTA